MGNFKREREPFLRFLASRLNVRIFNCVIPNNVLVHMKSLPPNRNTIMKIFHNANKHLVIRLSIVSLLALTSLSLSAEAQLGAKISPSISVQDVEKTLNSSKKIRSCHVIWKCVTHQLPLTDVNPEQRMARTLAWAKLNNFSAEQAQKMAEMERARAQRDIQGYTDVAVLNFVRVGNRVLSNVSSTESGDEGIDFFDGHNSLFGWTKISGKKVPVSATVVNDPKEVLSHSATREQEARFLLGVPLNEGFSESNPAFTQRNTTWTQEKKGVVTLESSDNLADPLDFSEAYEYPISYKVFDREYLVKDGERTPIREKTGLKIVAENFRKYQDGIWFPSEVNVTTPTDVTEYSLVKAEFNDEVDPIALRLPVGIRVADKRFGEDKILVYTPKDGQLPDDSEFRKMLGLKANEEVARGVEQKELLQPFGTQTSQSAIPLLGLLSIGFGVVLWSRANKIK